MPMSCHCAQLHCPASSSSSVLAGTAWAGLGEQSVSPEPALISILASTGRADEQHGAGAELPAADRQRGEPVQPPALPQHVQWVSAAGSPAPGLCPVWWVALRSLWEPRPLLGSVITLQGMQAAVQSCLTLLAEEREWWYLSQSLAMSQSPPPWVHIPMFPPALGAGTGLGKGAEMLSHGHRGSGALPLCWVLHPVAQALLGPWQRWPWLPPCTDYQDSGAGCGFSGLAGP